MPYTPLDDAHTPPNAADAKYSDAYAPSLDAETARAVLHLKEKWQAEIRSRLREAEAERDSWRRVAERVEEENQALAAHVEALREKQVAETCACAHDKATDVCLGHSPELRKVRAERDALAAHVERIKAHARYVGHTNPEESITAQILSEGPTTSLAHLKAETEQAFVDWVEHDLTQDGLFINFEKLLERYRRQAKGGER